MLNDKDIVGYATRAQISKMKSEITRVPNVFTADARTSDCWRCNLSATPVYHNREPDDYLKGQLVALAKWIERDKAVGYRRHPALICAATQVNVISRSTQSDRLKRDE